MEKPLNLKFSGFFLYNTFHNFSVQILSNSSLGIKTKHKITGIKFITNEQGKRTDVVIDLKKHVLTLENFFDVLTKTPQ